MRSLSTLEAELKVRLFNRTTRRIVLTEECKQYLVSWRQVLAAVDDAELALSLQSSEPSGSLTVTAPVQFGQLHVAPAATRFVQRYDKVRLQVVLLDRVVNLLEEGIDIGVRIGSLHDSSLIAHSVGRTRRVIVASPEFLSRHEPANIPRDLQKLNCICTLNTGSTTWSFQHNGRSLQVDVLGNIQFKQVAPAIDACVAGLGVSMLMSYQVEALVQAGQLVVLLESFELPPRPISLIYPHARLLPAKNRLFIEWMRKELASKNT